MLSAIRRSDGQIVNAYFESKANAPFACPQCGDPVALKTGKNKINHFAHVNPVSCKFATGENDAHRRCKLEIYQALQREPNVTNVALEVPMGTNRPDVFATISGVPVAIEVQISALPVETIMQRTIDYFRNGICVLWVLPWTPKLDSDRYTPKIWEKWIHTAYYGRVYYWIEGAKVASYRFDPHHRTIPKSTWYTKSGKKMTAGGYSERSKRYRTPVRGETYNIATDFVPKQRYWWEGNGVKVPDARLFMDRENPLSSLKYSHP